MISNQKLSNIIWKSISTSLNHVKPFQKLYFGGIKIAPARFCQSPLYRRIAVNHFEAHA